MKRATAIVLGLGLLLVVAFLLRREPRAEAPKKPPTPEPALVEPPAPEPEPIAAAPAPPKPPPPAPPPRPPPVPTPVTVADLLPMIDLPGTAIVRGTVRILGEPPPRRRIRMDADPKCVAQQPDAPLNDAWVIDREGRVRWAFVYVSHGINNLVPAKPLPPVLLDQVGCMYEPHVLGLRVGQALNITNSDSLLHNVHAQPFDNLEFNFGLPTRGGVQTVKFEQPEVMVRIGCDVHPWMRAWVGVLDHPYFCVTSDTGSYGIPNLPAGRYKIKVWHETYATVTRDVDVPPGGDIALDFTLQAMKR